MRRKLRSYTFTAAAKELGLSPNYIATLVERGKLTEEMVEVRGTRERFVTAKSVKQLKEDRAKLSEVG